MEQSFRFQAVEGLPHLRGVRRIDQKNKDWACHVAVEHLSVGKEDNIGACIAWGG